MAILLPVCNTYAYKFNADYVTFGTGEWYSIDASFMTR